MLILDRIESSPPCFLSVLKGLRWSWIELKDQDSCRCWAMKGISWSWIELKVLVLHGITVLQVPPLILDRIESPSPDKDTLKHYLSWSWIELKAGKGVRNRPFHVLSWSWIELKAFASSMVSNGKYGLLILDRIERVLLGNLQTFVLHPVDLG